MNGRIDKLPTGFPNENFKIKTKAAACQIKCPLHKVDAIYPRTIFSTIEILSDDKLKYHGTVLTYPLIDTVFKNTRPDSSTLTVTDLSHVMNYLHKDEPPFITKT